MDSRTKGRTDRQTFFLILITQRHYGYRDLPCVYPVITVMCSGSIKHILTSPAATEHSIDYISLCQKTCILNIFSLHPRILSVSLAGARSVSLPLCTTSLLPSPSIALSPSSLYSPFSLSLNSFQRAILPWKMYIAKAVLK